MTTRSDPCNLSPKKMSDSWIIIDDQDESDFVVIDDVHDNEGDNQC